MVSWWHFFLGIILSLGKNDRRLVAGRVPWDRPTSTIIKNRLSAWESEMVTWWHGDMLWCHATPCHHVTMSPSPNSRPLVIFNEMINEKVKVPPCHHVVWCMTPQQHLTPQNRRVEGLIWQSTMCWMTPHRTPGSPVAGQQTVFVLAKGSARDLLGGALDSTVGAGLSTSW